MVRVTYEDYLTVRELIKRLREYPEYARIYVFGDDGEYLEPQHLLYAPKINTVCLDYHGVFNQDDADRWSKEWR